MSFYFTKMHGLGNDFMIIDAVRQSIHLDKQTIIALAQRNTGVGFDQCLLIEPCTEKNIDFFYRIFNADGSEVGQCGNGARCLARFVQYYGLSDKKNISIATKTTCMQLQLNDDTTVTVNFGIPNLAPIHIPLQVKEQAPYYNLPLKNNKQQLIHAINVGNPHAIVIVKNLLTTPVVSLGQDISEHPFFPEQTNTGFMEIINPTQISLRVYERGCGETKACGSGAVAAAAVGRLYHQLDSRIEVKLLGGLLIVEWPNIAGPIFLTGPAHFVYEGSLPDDFLSFI